MARGGHYYCIYRNATNSKGLYFTVPDAPAGRAIYTHGMCIYDYVRITRVRIAGRVYGAYIYSRN